MRAIPLAKTANVTTQPSTFNGNVASLFDAMRLSAWSSISPLRIPSGNTGVAGLKSIEVMLDRSYTDITGELW